MEHEPISEFQSFYRNEPINPLVPNAFIFQNYILDLYQRKLERLTEVNHPCKVILMDSELDACHIFTTLKKERYTNFCFHIYQKYLQLKSRFFPGRLFATNWIFYLDTGPSEAMRCVRNCNRSSEDQITLNYLKSLDLQYSKYVTNLLS